MRVASDVSLFHLSFHLLLYALAALVFVVCVFVWLVCWVFLFGLGVWLFVVVCFLVFCKCI